MKNVGQLFEWSADDGSMSNPIQKNGSHYTPRQFLNDMMANWERQNHKYAYAFACAQFGFSSFLGHVYWRLGHILSDLRQVPPVKHPKVCEFLKDRVSRSKFAVVGAGFMGCLLYPSPIHQRILFGHALINAGFAFSFQKFVPKFCDSDPSVPSEELTEVVRKEIERFLEQWGPKPVPTGRVAAMSYRSYWQTVAPHDHIEGSDFGTALTFLAVLGGMAAAGAASGLSWTAESVMGATSRLPVPAFGY